MTSLTKTMSVSGTQGMTIQLDMYISNCPQCGVIFGITTDLEKQRRKDKGTFYCPNGHQMSWSKSEEDRLRERMKELEKETVQLRESRERYQNWLRNAREEQKRTERQLAAQKGQVTKLKKRVHAGVCPADGCQRHFADLQRHVKSKHPELLEEPAAAQP